jgi:hypothetical protein
LLGGKMPESLLTACTAAQICRGLISPKCRCGESIDVPVNPGKFRWSA